MSRTGVKRNMPSLRALKQEGHDIIDDLVRKGWGKGRVYQLLADKVGMQEPNVHFYNVYTERDARKLVKALRELRVELIEDRKEKRRVRNELAKTMRVNIPPHWPQAPAPHRECRRKWLCALLRWLGL
jgi:hypothetical protein